MIYIALEIDRPTLALVQQSLRDSIENFHTLAVDADAEENRHPSKDNRDRMRLGDDGLHVKGERQILWRANADSLAKLLVEQLLP